MLCNKILVITDLSMPHMTGFELAVALKNLHGIESIIALSSAEVEYDKSGKQYFD